MEKKQLIAFSFMALIALSGVSYAADTLKVISVDVKADKTLLTEYESNLAKDNKTLSQQAGLLIETDMTNKKALELWEQLDSKTKEIGRSGNIAGMQEALDCVNKVKL